MMLRLVARTLDEARRVVAREVLKYLKDEMSVELQLVDEGRTGLEGEALKEVHMLAQAVREFFVDLEARTKDSSGGCHVCQQAGHLLQIDIDRPQDIITHVEILQGDMNEARERLRGEESRNSELQQLVDALTVRAEAAEAQLALRAEEDG